MCELFLYFLRSQRFGQETAGAGVPRGKGILCVRGQKNHVHARVDLQKRAAQIQPADRAHFDIDKCQVDVVFARVRKRSRRLQEALNRRIRDMLRFS